MRILSTLLVMLTLINFSGIPEFLIGALGEDYSLCSYMDEESSKEDQQEKNKEERKEKEKEKEDALESLLIPGYILNGICQGSDLARYNRIIMESGFVPEDHSPPPELA